MTKLREKNLLVDLAKFLILKMDIQILYTKN